MKKEKNMIKRTIITLSFILCLITSVNGQNLIEPIVKYPNNPYTPEDRVIGDPSLLQSEGGGSNVAIGFFNRNLNKNKSALARDIKYYKPHIIEKTNYNIIRFYDTRSFWLQSIVGIYILNKQDIIVGYCLIGKIGNLKRENILSNSPIIAQMKSLNHNNSYLQNDLIIPSNVTVNFYEQEHDTFIERYCFAEDSKYEALILEAFYPKELEYDLVLYIKQVLNANFNEFLLQ